MNILNQLLDLEFLDEDERLAAIEANELTKEQLYRFYNEVENQPASRSPIDGKACRLAFEFMEDTGLRITELLHVRKMDLDFRTRILTVIHPKSEVSCKCSVWRYRDLQTRKRILVSADKNCNKCHGKGKWKKPQRTTFTPKMLYRLYEYCQSIPKDEDLLWPTTRQSFWNWGKAAGKAAKIDIFTQKEERKIDGIFLHLFRALCSKRMKVDAQFDPYLPEMTSIKLRHSLTSGEVRDRYTKVDINYLIRWESKNYK